jgi:phenylacetaldehyde dehydrogenase
MGSSATAVAEMENDLSVLSEKTRRFLAAEHKMFIGADDVSAKSGNTFSVLDPTSGKTIARVPAGEAADIEEAAAAARRAFDDGPWPRMKPVERERTMLRLADLLEKHAEEVAEIESVNTGRTIPNTRAFDVNLSVDYLRYMAGWATKIHGDTYRPSVPYAPGADFFSYTLREPVGVVGAITPWNVPLGLAIWKIAPVLATGCTMVLKPAEQTPLTALRFGQLIREAGVPPGVVNIVTGFGDTAGAALVEHPEIDMITFTGSTEVGYQIAAKAAATLKRYTLELGGKSAMLVLPDADPEIAVPGTAMAIFSNHGQNCCAGSRLYVHRDIFDEHMKGVTDFARNIRLGPALDPKTEMGPLVSKAQQKRVLGYIESGIRSGAELLSGGQAMTDHGAYVQPTVIGNVRQEMPIVQEEIFGPVLVATPFDNLDEAVQQANATKYGLGASIWTRDIRTVHRLIPRLKAGTVWVNTHNVLDLAVPFGGVKSSGIGRELGEEAVRHHTELKTVTMAV